MDRIIIGIVAIICLIMSIVNMYKFIGKNNAVIKVIRNHNKKIIFVNNPDLDIKQECYQMDNFFLMRNSGKHPCEETKEYKYIRYDIEENYYI